MPLPDPGQLHRVRRDRERRAAGAAVADILSGAWREPVSAWSGRGDLESLAPLLLRGGVGALAWRRLPAERRGEPGALALQQAFRLQALRAEVHTEDAGRACALLRAAGVQPLLGKGWAAARLYPDAALRPYGDVDLYVPARSLGAARAAVNAPGAGCTIDLHAGLAELDDRAHGDVDAHAVTADANGRAVRTFGPEDHLRLLALHALRHGLLRPLWLCDVAAAVEGRPAGFDWPYFLRGDATRTRWALTAIGLAHRVLGARLDGVPDAARVSDLPRWLVPAVLAEWGAGRAAHGGRMPMARALRRPADLVRAVGERWPNGVEATIGARAPFGAGPLLPLQLAECARRSLRFVGARVGSH